MEIVQFAFFCFLLLQGKGCRDQESVTDIFKIPYSLDSKELAALGLVPLRNTKCTDQTAHNMPCTIQSPA